MVSRSVFESYYVSLSSFVMLVLIVMNILWNYYFALQKCYMQLSNILMRNIYIEIKYL